MKCWSPGWLFQEGTGENTARTRAKAARLSEVCGAEPETWLLIQCTIFVYEVYIWMKRSELYSHSFWIWRCMSISRKRCIHRRALQITNARRTRKGSTNWGFPMDTMIVTDGFLCEHQSKPKTIWVSCFCIFSFGKKHSGNVQLPSLNI